MESGIESGVVVDPLPLAYFRVSERDQSFMVSTQLVRRTGSWIVTLVGDAARRVIERVGFRGLPTQMCRGLRIVALTAAPAEPLIAKIARALSLIAEVDPRRFARLQGDVDQIVVMPLKDEGAAYVQRSRTCYLSDGFVTGRSDLSIAFVLVHEATHARIERAGVRQWRDRETRYERICVAAELAFASKLPPSMLATIEDRMHSHWRRSGFEGPEAGGGRVAMTPDQEGNCEGERPQRRRPH